VEDLDHAGHDGPRRCLDAARAWRVGRGIAALLDAFLRLESAGIAPADANKQGSEFGFVSALTRGAAGC